MKTNLKYYMDNFPVIESENLILREIMLEDLEDLAECLCDSEIYKYWGSNLSTPEKNLTHTTTYYDRFLKRAPNEERNCFYWGIAQKSNHKIKGQIFINNIYRNRIGHIGYRLSRKLWNKGITTEAVKAVLKFMFENTEMKRIETDVIKENEASCKVLEKCGFIKEGFIRQGKFGNMFCDFYKYGFIKSDYKK